MSLRHGLLGLLNYDPMTGYELNKLFNESLGHFWQAKASQIYRELDTMEKNGWLTSQRVIQDEKPNKRVYSITEQGKVEFLDWLTNFDPFKPASGKGNAFLMRIFFGGELSSESTLELLRVAKEHILKQMEQLQAVMDEVNAMVAEDDEEYAKTAKYWKLTALYGEMINKAGIEWADKAISILEEGD